MAINTLAGRAEHATSKPLLTRSHGLFSIGVVITSLGTGSLLGAGLSLVGAFIVVAAAMLSLAVVTYLLSAALDVASPESVGSTGDDRPRRSRLGRLIPSLPLLVVGLVAALAYAVENAHQSWGAVMLTDVFLSSPQVAAAAPAALAATAALARLTTAPLSRSHPTVMLIGGGALAAAGSAVLATAPSVTLALVGLVLAAAGTATLFPTLLSRSLRGLDPAEHGRATSAVAATAYLGFLLGPAYVGLLAEAFGLRAAVLGVAALALMFTLTAAPISTRAARHPGPATSPTEP